MLIRGAVLAATLVTVPLLAGTSVSAVVVAQPTAPVIVVADAPAYRFPGGNPPTPGRRPSSPQPPALAPVDCRAVKCLALTFDDGPVRHTADVLDVLQSRGARATFFVLGNHARKHPELLRRMVELGDAVGNHSWNHPILFGKSTAAIRRQFVRTQRLIDAAIGTQPMLVRAPFGQLNKRIKKLLGRLGSPAILWDVDPRDWKNRTAKTVERRVVKAAHRNAIVLMHDVWPSTRKAVARIVDRLQAKGYVLVTVPELLAGRLKPGKRYLHG